MKTKKITFTIKSLFVGLFSIISVSAFSQKTDTIRVSTIDELFEAIASNKVVLLEEGNYDISKLDHDKKTNSAKMQVIEGITERQLLISGVSNCKIIGIGKKQSKIYTPSPSITVIRFKNCKNIVIDNIDAGHKAAKGDCSANVFDIFDCENFVIKNSILFGSGYIGIFANNSKKLSLIKTTITECSWRLLYMENCMNTTVDSCVFSKTAGGLALNNCLNFTISNTTISENTMETYKDDYGNLLWASYLFDITASANVKLIKSHIESNTASYLVKNSQLLNIDSDTDFSDNKFIGTFKN
jgi:parallel beta-helix repeat protein